VKTVKKYIKKVLPKDENFKIVINQFTLSIGQRLFLNFEQFSYKNYE